MANVANNSGRRQTSRLRPPSFLALPLLSQPADDSPAQHTLGGTPQSTAAAAAPPHPSQRSTRVTTYLPKREKKPSLFLKNLRQLR